MQNDQSMLKLRWLLYIGGMSIDSPIKLISLLVIMASTILEVKCSKFLLKLYDLSASKIQ
jgi:hypothetical protein